MKNNITKVFWKDPWTIMSFPRQGCSIIYDGEKKEYDFYEGVANTKDTKQPVVCKKKVSKRNPWYTACIILASAFGITLALLLTLLLFN